MPVAAAEVRAAAGRPAAEGRRLLRFRSAGHHVLLAPCLVGRLVGFSHERAAPLGAQIGRPAESAAASSLGAPNAQVSVEVCASNCSNTLRASTRITLSFGENIHQL